MISLLSRALPLAALLFAVSSASQSDTSENQAPLVPVEAFASLPTFDDAKLPPNGEKVAYAITHKGRKHVITQNLDGSDRQLIPPIDDADISSFFWANNETLLVKYGMTLNRMEFRATTKETRYIAYHTNGEKPRWLGKPKQDLGRQKSGNIEYMSQVEHIVDRLPNDPNHILMELDFELDTQPSVFKVNVNNGRRSQVRGGKRGVQNWYTDNESEVRLGSGYVTRGTKKVMMYKGTDGKWIDLKKLDWTDWYSIYDFANEPDTLYVGGNSEYGTTGIFTVNVLTGQISSHVFTHENVDIDDLASHPVTGKLAGVSYADNFYRTHYFDKELALLQRSFDKVLPGAINRIASISTEKQLYLIYSASDTNPGDYYLYDRPNRQLNFIANRMAHINPSHMAHTKEVRITMRDGSTIPAFLTLPKGKENTKNLPFLIMPHGGPESRDTAHWDYKAQFLANRGYGVLKPNFRGSTGYGNAFEAAGSNQWGGLMQDDVTDATQWLIREGIADPDRICITGASYGGYAALMGVIKEQGLYKCAISINGVTDLPRLKASDTKFVGGRVWTKDMGLKGADDKQVSPYDRAEEVNVPVLIMSSKDDARIPYYHSKDMHKRLKKLGKDSTYIKIEDGGHSMVTMESRLTALKATEAFLARHIGQ